MSTRTAEYGEILAQFQAAVLAADKAGKVRADSLEKAREELKELERLREENLERMLEEINLAVCSEHHHSGEASARRELGVFPKREIRLLYSSTIETIELGAGQFGVTPKRVSTLKALCPSHFPENPNRSVPTKNSCREESDEMDITSEVVERDGRLVAVLDDSIDLSGLEVKKRYSEEIYKHFGLPELPELP